MGRSALDVIMRTAGGPVAENMRLYVYRRGTTTQQQLYSSETGIGTVANR